MILYRDTKHADRIHPPPWLDGADNLQIREDKDGRLFGIGDGRLVGPAHPRLWVPIADGIEARLIQPFVPSDLLRYPRWSNTIEVHDLQGRVWPVPQILSQDGSTLAIQVTYGAGWQPALTPLQAQAEKAARWARQSLIAAVEADAGIAVKDGCQAAAELLSSVLHITPEILSALQLMDQAFVVVVLRTAAGWVPEAVGHE